MKKGKIAAYLLASAITLTSCGNKEEEKTIIVDDLLCTEIVYTEEEVLNNLEKIYDEYTKNKENCDLMGRNEVLEAAFLEHNIKDSEVDQEEVIKELNFLLECYIANYDMTEEEYKISFKTLSKTTLRNIEIYYPLAECMHLYSCPLNHKEYDNIITCDALEKYNFSTTIKGYEDLVARACTTSDDENVRILYMKLYNSGIDMSILLDELNSVYYFCQVPIDMGVDWEFYFSNLESTLKEGESLFDTYYDFAVYIHTLTCEHEHELNEYAAFVCDNMRLTKSWEE